MTALLRFISAWTSFTKATCKHSLHVFASDADQLGEAESAQNQIYIVFSHRVGSNLRQLFQ